MERRRRILQSPWHPFLFSSSHTSPPFDKMSLAIFSPSLRPAKAAHRSSALVKALLPHERGYGWQAKRAKVGYFPLERISFAILFPNSTPGCPYGSVR